MPCGLCISARKTVTSLSWWSSTAWRTGRGCPPTRCGGCACSWSIWSALKALVVEPACLECLPGHLAGHHRDWRLHYGPPGSEFEMSVLLNHAGPFPRGLERFKRTGRVTDDIIRHVPRGEAPDLGPHVACDGALLGAARSRHVLVVERLPPFKLALWERVELPPEGCWEGAAGKSPQ